MKRAWRRMNNRRRFPFHRMNRRQVAALAVLTVVLLLGTVVAVGLWLPASGLSTQLEARNQPPSAAHWFGTDWLGRDMLTRTLKGLTLSIGVGLAAACCSTMLAAVLAVLATLSKLADRLVSWVTDLFLSVPHLVTLILISYLLGGGVKGVLVGISLTHWPALLRILRAELLQLRSKDYVQLSVQLGKSRRWIACNHLLPHLLPQLLTGLLLIFPHAILHEAAITFVGLGLSPHQPAIGIILSESMRYLSTGYWWLAFFPGACLLIIVRAFDRAGEHLKRLASPASSQE